MTATSADLKAIERLIESLPADKLAELREIPEIKSRLGKWKPNPGPQTAAYYSEADVLGYGGEPGGGKSQLILGLAFNEHQRSFVMRREYGDLERLIDDALTIHGSRIGFNGSPPPRLRISDKKTIHFRAAQRVGDEKNTMGQGRDLLGIDEATQFAESQVRFLMGWVRTEDPNQRCRVVLATNPPLTAEGLWFKKMFAPWIDETFPEPAQYGELRWVVTDEEGNDEWVDGPDDTRLVRGKVVKPLSRTFIPSSVRDNPYYVDTEYEQQLDAMPEPFRSILLGGFKTEFKDAEHQLIPTAWIRAAMERWHADGWKEYEMTAMAFDAAGGGDDDAVLAFRHNGWYGPLEAVNGEETADASAMAALIVQKRRANAPVIVDMGGGYGNAIALRLKDNDISYRAFNGANRSTIIGRDGLTFVNKRAEACWRFREQLDPDQEGGSAIALPNDPELLADLASLTIEVRTNGILIESKESIRKRLGRSPGKGDAVIMCLDPGDKAVQRDKGRRNPPKVHLGYPKTKQHRRRLSG